MNPFHRRSLGSCAVIGLVLSVLVFSGCSTTSPSKRERLAEAYHKIGRSFFNNAEYQRAFVEFQKSVESDAGHRDSHYFIGHIYWIRGEMEKAEVQFKRTLKLDPDFSDAHNNLGIVYRIRGNLDGAVMEYQMALDNPKYPTPHFALFNLGMAYMDLEKYASALQAFSNSRNVEPSYLQAYIGEGRALMKLDRYGEAVESLEKLVAQDPNYPSAHFFLGVAHYDMGAHDQARESFEKVVELAPEGELVNNSKDYLSRLQ